MLKTMMAAGAALLVAGTASAAEVQVVVDPDADGEIIVRHVEWTPAMNPDFVGAKDEQGMLSADELVEGAGPECRLDFVLERRVEQAVLTHLGHRFPRL